MGQKKGYKLTEEHKIKISDSQKGNTNALGYKHSEETKTKRRLTVLENNTLCWKGGKTVDSNGYILIYSPNHPYASKKYYVFEHRLIMEEALGRYLTRKEVVHHEGEKDDNKIEKLMLFANNAEHTRYHKMLIKDKKYSTCGQL